jgi:hypothetical protein
MSNPENQPHISIDVETTGEDLSDATPVTDFLPGKWIVSLHALRQAEARVTETD